MSLILPQLSMLSVGEAAFTPLEFHDYATDQANSSGNSTVNYPAGTAEGDLLFLVGGQNISSGSFTTPSGWTFLSARSASGYSAELYWRIAGAETSVTLNSSGGANGGAALFVYKGTAPDSINVTLVENAFTSNNNPGAVTAQADSIVAVAIVLSVSTYTITPSSGYTERADDQAWGAGGGRIGFFDKAITVDGSENPGATTHSTAFNTSWTIAPIYS